jgi:hypothetical protein
MRKLSNYLLFNFIFLSFFSYSQPSTYFQQDVNYTIAVQLNDVKHSLSANITIDYKNNSKDTLFEIWMHLWPNAYKNRDTELSKQELIKGSNKIYFAKDDDRGYIDSLAFKIDNKKVVVQPHPKWIDACKLILHKPLLPGQQITISTPFYVKLPDGKLSRLGHLGQAYAITQWYPKPAVYDKDGWHVMPYLTIGEFYSEYGSFDVKITLPQNYVVGATGDLVDGNAELVWLDGKVKETKEKLEFPKSNFFPPSSGTLKTLHYHQEQVHDFAWFADKRYNVLKGETILPSTGDTVTTWAMFTNYEAELWKNSIEYMNDALLFYSDKIGDYPYKQCTAVDGTIAAGAGMEYPNVTIIGSSNDERTLEVTIVHEIGHNWFYGILGSNERDHPWMDEGLNSYYEALYMMKKYPPSIYGKKSELSSLGFLNKISGGDQFDYLNSNAFSYRIPASIRNDQSISLNSSEYTNLNYGISVYSKPKIVFNQLSKYLGDSVFENCIKNYYKQWSYKHPQPDDFKKVFADVSQTNLDWYFNNLIESTNQTDYSLTEILKKENGYLVTLKNKGAIGAPIEIAAIKNDSIISRKWITPVGKDTTLFIECFDCNKIQLDPDLVSNDVKLSNNQIKTKGILKRIEPISASPLFHFDAPSKSRIFYLPAIAWNDYNKLMLGIVLHNQTLPYKKFEYAIAPMYAFGDKSFAGTGNIAYHIFPKKGFLQELTFATSARRFAYQKSSYLTPDGENEVSLHYERYEPSIEVDLRKPNHLSPISQSIKASYVKVVEDRIEYAFGGSFPFSEQTANYQSDFFRINYTLQNNRALDPWSAIVNLETHKDYTKLSAELNYKFLYGYKKKGINVRGFAGYQFTDLEYNPYGFNLSDRSSTSGTKDYAYDNLYFGRTETEEFISRQIALRDGAFKAYTPFGSFKKNLFALNLDIDLPINFPIGFYIDLGTTDGLKEDIRSAYNLDVSVSYSAGISFKVISNLVAIYIPLINSKEINEYYSFSETSFGEKIRFTFNINELNPLRYKRTFLNQ